MPKLLTAREDKKRGIVVYIGPREKAPEVFKVKIKREVMLCRW